MRSIIINDKNAEKINETIRAEEGRASVRLMDYDRLTRAVEVLEKRLHIAKKNMVGIEADIDWHANSFPACYKGVPESTHVTVVRTTSGWKLTAVGRYPTRGVTDTFRVTLTDQARKAILASCERF